MEQMLGGQSRDGADAGWAEQSRALSGVLHGASQEKLEPGLGVNEVLLEHVCWLLTTSRAGHFEPAFPLADAKPEGKRICAQYEVIIYNLRNLRTISFLVNVSA